MGLIKGKVDIMRSETEIQSLKEVSEMAAQSLNPELYEKFCEVHDELIRIRSIPLKHLDYLDEITKCPLHK